MYECLAYIVDGTFPFVHVPNVSTVKGGTELMIATDPLSLLFIACFLTGLVFFIVTALLGNLGHGMTHNVAHHSGVVHTTGTHAASNGSAHTSGQTAGFTWYFPYPCEHTRTAPEPPYVYQSDFRYAFLTWIWLFRLLLPHYYTCCGCTDADPGRYWRNCSCWAATDLAQSPFQW